MKKLYALIALMSVLSFSGGVLGQDNHNRDEHKVKHDSNVNHNQGDDMGHRRHRRHRPHDNIHHDNPHANDNRH
jgi:hypothetical protein